MTICKHLQEDNFCQTAFEGTDPESGVECDGHDIECEFYEEKAIKRIEDDPEAVGLLEYLKRKYTVEQIMNACRKIYEQYNEDKK